ncbi:methyltransferase type 11 [Candidatus Marinamargulisbacteria bacterium SCGC AG-343-K17]|nr:methyltransferase type 11 [Candidatus Marinamargulisbacteria bacterium SCGC AG-343-K17]
MSYLLPFRFNYFYPKFKKQPITILDVGCGNQSPTVTKKYFPQCIYHGVDRGNYNNSGRDMGLMDAYFELDLEESLLDELSDCYYDLIILSHVIEHLDNGLDVVERLSKKLKPGGHIYIEYPSLKSLQLPSADGSLHFCDDVTHKRLYHMMDIANELMSNDCMIIVAKTRRSRLRIMLSPIGFVFNLFYYLFKRKIHSMLMWDILGFAEFIIAKKK